ncbi:MAG: hypothetical protein ACOC3X_02330, partial [Nanoarchaeota archaeon]
MPKKAKEILSNVHPNETFKTALGKEIISLEELVKTLENMDDNEFKIHVNEEKNDYANWINDSIKDEVLAFEIKHVKDKKKIINTIKKRITELEKRIKMGEIVDKIKSLINTKKNDNNEINTNENIKQNQDVNIKDDLTNNTENQPIFPKSFKTNNN